MSSERLARIDEIMQRHIDAGHISGAVTAVRTSPSPAEACAGRNFISRALCLGRQCQAPGAHLHPECADELRKEEKRQRWMDR